MQATPHLILHFDKVTTKSSGSASLFLLQIRLKISLLTLCIHSHFPKDLVAPKYERI